MVCSHEEYNLKQDGQQYEDNCAIILHLRTAECNAQELHDGKEGKQDIQGNAEAILQLHHTQEPDEQDIDEDDAAVHTYIKGMVTRKHKAEHHIEHKQHEADDEC